jgi:hypothetical protein
MLFKNPNLLYALFFLAVPIIIHLFQLRRFRKVEFTNVAFLKPLKVQTRKSQLIKRWLTLLTRLLIIACLVLAFAQPYLPAEDYEATEKQTLIYLDNSYSMQAVGENGPLFYAAVNELLDNLPPDKSFTLFTNNNMYLETTRKAISNELLKSGYSSNSLTYPEIKLKAESTFKDSKLIRELILISDFQKFENVNLPEFYDSFEVKMVKITPESSQNVSIDSVYMSSTDSKKRLGVTLSANYTSDLPVTLTLKNKNLLISKTAVTLENKRAVAYFDLPEMDELNGMLSIEDQSLEFDNDFYLSFNQSKKIKILAINDADDSFLKKVYVDDLFELISNDFNQTNYNSIKDQNLIVLNELKNIPPALALELNALTKNGGKIAVIPNKDSGNYNAVLNTQSFEMMDKPKKVTSINYDHPLFKNVFNKKVTNFQYPSVEFATAPYYATYPILTFEDGSSFIYENDSRFVFTAPINQEISNFQNSPIIVPIFYNMAINSLPLPRLYNYYDSSQEIAIPVVAQGDKVLKLSNNGIEIIPLQRAYDSYTTIQTGSEINLPGNYEVLSDNETVGTLSFNDKRDENKLEYYTIDELGDTAFTTVSNLFDQLAEDEKINTLWKLFLIGALFFLLCEMLILKFVK